MNTAHTKSRLQKYRASPRHRGRGRATHIHLKRCPKRRKRQHSTQPTTRNHRINRGNRGPRAWVRHFMRVCVQLDFPCSFNRLPMPCLRASDSHLMEPDECRTIP